MVYQWELYFIAVAQCISLCNVGRMDSLRPQGCPCCWDFPSILVWEDNPFNEDTDRGGNLCFYCNSLQQDFKELLYVLVCFQNMYHGGCDVGMLPITVLVQWRAIHYKRHPNALQHISRNGPLVMTLWYIGLSVGKAGYAQAEHWPVQQEPADFQSVCRAICSTEAGNRSRSNNQLQSNGYWVENKHSISSCSSWLRALFSVFWRGSLLSEYNWVKRRDLCINIACASLGASKEPAVGVSLGILSCITSRGPK